MSNPDSASYGDFLSRDEVNALTRPSTASLDAVRDFVARELGNVAVDDRHVGFLSVRAPVSVVERAFECTLRLVAHSSGAQLIRTQRYTVSDELARHIDFVAGLVRLPRVGRKTTSRPSTAPVIAPQQQELAKRQNLPWLGITPRLLRERYNCSDVYPSAKNNRQSIAQFLGQVTLHFSWFVCFMKINIPTHQYYSTVDLEEFFALMFQELIGTTPSRVIGPNGWSYLIFIIIIFSHQKGGWLIDDNYSIDY